MSWIVQDSGCGYHNVTNVLVAHSVLTMGELA